MSDITNRLNFLDKNLPGYEGKAIKEAIAEIKRLREELVAADEHAKRLEALIEKVTVWEPDKEGRLG